MYILFLWLVFHTFLVSLTKRYTFFLCLMYNAFLCLAWDLDSQYKLTSAANKLIVFIFLSSAQILFVSLECYGLQASHRCSQNVLMGEHPQKVSHCAKHHFVLLSKCIHFFVFPFSLILSIPLAWNLDSQHKLISAAKRLICVDFFYT